MTNACTDAISYLRTSSATNVDGDSSARQRAAIDNYARHAGLRIVGEHYDAAVSGAVPVMDRPAFAAMVASVASNGVRLILVEDATRFARDLMVQEIGLLAMRQLGVRVVTASGIDLTDDTSIDGETVRVILGQFAAAEKKRLVAKLRGARDRKSIELGRRCERRTVDAERYVALRELRAAHPDAKLHELSAMLAERGFFTTPTKRWPGGKPLSVQAVSLALSRAA